MINVNCSNCDICCYDPLTPVLLPCEENLFNGFYKKIKTPFRVMLLLKKYGKHCIFLDNKNKRCSIYENRPFECRFYPLLLDLGKLETSFKIDKRFCPSLKSLKYDYQEIIKYLKTLDLPIDWIKGYEYLQDC